MKNMRFDLPYHCDYCDKKNNVLEAQLEKGRLWVRCKACRIGKWWDDPSTDQRQESLKLAFRDIRPKLSIIE